jgi:hypothetical protein
MGEKLSFFLPGSHLLIIFSSKSSDQADRQGWNEYQSKRYQADDQQP